MKTRLSTVENTQNLPRDWWCRGFAFDSGLPTGPHMSFVVTMQKLVCGVMRARRSGWINGWTLPKLYGEVFGVCGFVSHWDLHGWSIFHKKSCRSMGGCGMLLDNLCQWKSGRSKCANFLFISHWSLKKGCISLFQCNFLCHCVARWLTVSEPTTPVSFWRVAVARVRAALEAWRFVALRVGSFCAVQDTVDCNHLFHIWRLSWQQRSSVTLVLRTLRVFPTVDGRSLVWFGLEYHQLHVGTDEVVRSRIVVKCWNERWNSFQQHQQVFLWMIIKSKFSL